MAHKNRDIPGKWKESGNEMETWILWEGLQGYVWVQCFRTGIEGLEFRI